MLFAAGMMGVEGRLQPEGKVEHVIADRLVELSPSPARVGERGTAALDAAPSAKHRSLAAALGIETKDDLNPDLLIGPADGIVVRPRDFR